MFKQLLERSTTPPMKRRLLRVFHGGIASIVRFRVLTGQLGPLPDFVVIGAQKGGTTYMYNELVRHPNVAAALTKEVHFFDDNYRKGEATYRAYFPASLGERPSNGASRKITGEASPDYLFHPQAPRRLARMVPQAKLIALLRNPVSRAYSHYHHEVRLGFETQSFEAAIISEAERVRGERERMLRDEYYPGNKYMHYSYLGRGIYADQLQAWLEWFPRQQMLILKSEDFYKDTPAIMGQVLDFLGLPARASEGYTAHMPSSYPKLNPAMKAHLSDYFVGHNRRLYDLLGVDFGWGG